MTVVEETPRERPISGYDGPRRKVLIVDDVGADRAVLTAYLRMLGFHTVEAAHGLEAIAQAEATRPDLILMDSAMPQMDGVEAMRRLRRSPTGARVPIIAVSAKPLAADAERCILAGANAFLAKPVDPTQLLEQIGLLLKLRWTRAA